MAKVMNRMRRMTLTAIKVTDAPVVPPPLTASILNTNFRINRQVSSATVKIRISDYQLLKQLGSGTFGTVWLGRKKKTSQFYAIKVLEKRKIWQSNSQITLANEARVMRKLKGKPFSIEICESFSNSKYVFMALELADRGDLGILINKRILLDRAEVSYYLVQIASGLNALHKSKIIHRDLKPSNVLLTSEGHVKLADFGLSKDLSLSNGRAMSICGTPEYMAPEVIRGEGATYATDYYSLGIMVHQLYTGKIPYLITESNYSRTALMEAIVNLEVHPSKHMKAEGQSLIFWFTHQNPKSRPKGIQQLKTHPWLKQLDWSGIITKRVASPLIIKEKCRLIRSASIDPKFDKSDEYEPRDYEVLEDYGDAFVGF